MKISYKLKNVARPYVVQAFDRDMSYQYCFPVKKLSFLAIYVRGCMTEIFDKADPELLLEKLPETSGLDRIRVLADLSEIYRESDPGKSIEFGKKGLELLSVDINTELESRILKIICWCAQWLGEFNTSLEYGFRLLDIADKSDNDEYRSVAFHEIGVAYWRLDRLDKALDYCLKAMKIYEESGNKKGISSILNNIGMICNGMGDERKALEYYLESIKIKEELDQTTGLANSLNNAAIIYRSLEEYEKALEYYQRALEIHRKQGTEWGISHVLINIGTVYRYLKDYEKSLEYFFRSLEIEEETGDKQGKIDTLFNIARIFSVIDRHSEALEYAHKGLDCSNATGSPDIRKNCEVMSEILERKGDFREALEYYKKYKALHDKIFTEESRNRYNELQVSYETEKKEKESEIYRLRNIELVKANEKLIEALSEVNTLSGLLPICASCKKIRDDSGYWEQIEGYISERSDAQFSHGICPECMKKLYPEYTGHNYMDT